jgi:hypothetical protein
MSDVHVVPDGGGWMADHDGRTTSTHRTQGHAIEAGRHEAKIDRCKLVIRGADGQSREMDSEGDHPREVVG